MEKEPHSAQVGIQSPIAVHLEGPFAATTFLWRGRRGELQCSVIVKTTYLLRSGSCPVADRPDPIWTADLHWDSSPLRSVRVPSDLAPLKHAPEVTLVGHAFSPDGQPIEQLAVRLSVGDIDKSLDVFPTRGWTREGVLESPVAARMPLGYEQAAGGPDTENPVGVDTELIDELGRRPAPSVIHAGHIYERLDDIALPAGFGPVAAVWPARVQRLRREDLMWLAEPANKPMPHGFDSRYFQVAPLDQWLTEPLRSDERIVLENLVPGRERLATNLKAMVPHAAVVMWKTMPVSLTPDTLFIDTDRAIVTLTWRGSVEVGEGSLPSKVLVTRAPQAGSSSPPAWDDVGTFTTRAAELAHPETGEKTLPAALQRNLVTRSAWPGPASSPTRTIPVPPPNDEVASVRAGLLPPPPSVRSAVPPPPPTAPVQAPLITMHAPPSPGPPSVGASRSSTATLPPPAPDPVKTAPTKRPSRISDTSLLAVRPAADVADGPLRRQALVDLLGFDASLPARLRRTATFAKILGPALERPASPRPEELRAERARDDRGRDDRADVLRVLSFAEPCDLPRARALVEEAFADVAQLELPIAIVSGALAPSHDDVEVLRALKAVGAPLASGSEALRAALKRVDEVLGWGYPPSAEVVSALLHEAEEAAGSMGSKLRGHVQRIALDGRCYKRRTVVGEARIRAELTTRGGESLPVYIPDSVAAKLPMLPSFPVVVVAELRPREDAEETHAEALIALALGRVVRQVGSPSLGS